MNLQEYRARDAQVERELEQVGYYLLDFFSYARVPDQAYIDRFKKLVTEDPELSDYARKYILERTDLRYE